MLYNHFGNWNFICSRPNASSAPKTQSEMKILSPCRRLPVNRSDTQSNGRLKMPNQPFVLFVLYTTTDVSPSAIRMSPSRYDDDNTWEGVKRFDEIYILYIRFVYCIVYVCMCGCVCATVTNVWLLSDETCRW